MVLSFCSCEDASQAIAPAGKNHGAPSDEDRHVGDLGNIEPNSKGVAKGSIVDKFVQLRGPYSVMGRSFMVRCAEGKRA